MDAPGVVNTIGWTALGTGDNDQTPPVQGPDAGLPLILDDWNVGTSFAAATATATAAIVRQYFSDGFYPDGVSRPEHSIPDTSGALVKAMLVMMTNAMTERISNSAAGLNGNDRLVAGNRCGTFLGNDSLGNPIGVVGNFEQGCGRPILAQGLPLANYPDSQVYPLVGPGTPENPAAGLVVHDFIATGEPVFTGSPVTKTIDIYKSEGQLRCALAWVDPPDAGSGGVLINDLNLELVSPGGIRYHGNVYSGDWAQPDPDPAAFDDKNPFEAIHIDQPETGTWTVHITGTVPLGNSGPNEDADGDFRLDPG